MTFDEMAQEHLKALKRRGRSESTIDNRSCHLAQLGTFLAGREPTIELLREWSDSLSARGLKVRSQWTAIVNVRAFYNWAAEEGLIPSNPAKRLEKPRLPKHLPQALSMDQAQQLLDAAAASHCPERDEAMILFLLETGCRRGGAATLRVGDLDLENGRARVVEKGDRERLVFMSGRTIEALRRWLRVRDASKFRGQYQNTDRLWGMGPWGVGLRIRDLARAAGIKAHCHSLRHTAAVMRLMNGVDAGSLIAIMGWAGPEMLKTYGVLAASQLQAQALKSSPLASLQRVAVGRSSSPARPIRGRILPARA